MAFAVWAFNKQVSSSLHKNYESPPMFARGFHFTLPTVIELCERHEVTEGIS